MNRAEIGVMVEAAADGDEAAWKTLVAELAPLVWSIIRAHGLPDAAAHDVYQEVWFRFVVNLKALPEPPKAGVWLAGTTRRECLEALRPPRRPTPFDEQWLLDPDSGNGAFEPTRPDEGATAADSKRIRILWEEFEQLGAPCKRLLRVLMASPPLSYEEVSAALGIPVGSIGPKRQRCLRRLRARIDTRVHDSAPAAGTRGSSPVTAAAGVPPDRSTPPGCRVRLRLLDDDPRTGTPVRLTAELVAAPAHPWARPAVRPVLEVVAVPLSDAEVEPALVLYGPGDAASAPFRVTAARPGAHRLRFTFFHHDTGVALQQVETVLDIASPEHTGSGKPGAAAREGRT
ncbi:RNA polymerase sigma factor [Streptomyces echinatus]|uniref:RNA polymerase sigma factor n=1 Tax=Streptomyces echinatus TaxID=67293 RepID=UPI00379CAEFC